MIFYSCKVDITPNFPLVLCGYNDRKEPFFKVSDPIEANIFLFNNEEDFLILVSLDALFAGDDMRDAIIKALKELPLFFNKKLSLVCFASHTHFAGCFTRMQSDVVSFNEKYHDYVIEKIIHKISEINHSDGHKNVRFECNDIEFNEFVVNRRRSIVHRLRKKTILAPNFLKKVQTESYILKFISEDNKTLGVLWNMACHPTNFYNRHNISSCYIGNVRDHFRETLGENLVVFFIQGFAGDVSPYENDKVYTKFNKLFFHLFKRTRFTPNTHDLYNAWIGKLIVKIDESLSKPPKTVDTLNKITYRISQISFDEFLEKHSLMESSLTAIRIDLNDYLSILAISCEPVNDYTALVKSLFPQKILILGGYINSVYVYLPTNSMLAEGGYEVEGFFELFNIKGKFKSNINQSLKELLSQLRD